MKRIVDGHALNKPTTKSVGELGVYSYGRRLELIFLPLRLVQFPVLICLAHYLEGEGVLHCKVAQ